MNTYSGKTQKEKIEVSFWVKGKEGAYLSEEDLEWHIPELTKLEDLPGFIIINSKTNNVQLSDDLDYIIPKLCFFSINSLVSNKSYNITRASCSGSYEIRADQEQVWISGTNIHQVVFQEEELFKALYQCGSRFLEFLMRLSVDTDKFEGTINELEAAQTMAQKFIQEE